MKGIKDQCERGTNISCNDCQLQCWKNLVDERGGTLSEFQKESEDDIQFMTDEVKALLVRNHNKLKPMTPQ